MNLQTKIFGATKAISYQTLTNRHRVLTVAVKSIVRPSAKEPKNYIRNATHITKIDQN